MSPCGCPDRGNRHQWHRRPRRRRACPDHPKLPAPSLSHTPTSALSSWSLRLAKGQFAGVAGDYQVILTAVVLGLVGCNADTTISRHETAFEQFLALRRFRASTYVQKCVCGVHACIGWFTPHPSKDILTHMRLSVYDGARYQCNKTPTA